MNGPVWHWPLSAHWYFSVNVIIIKYTSHHGLSVLQPRNFSRCQFSEKITTTLFPTYALAFGPHYDPNCSLFQVLFKLQDATIRPVLDWHKMTYVKHKTEHQQSGA